MISPCGGSVRPHKSTRKDWEHETSSAQKTTPRDILRLHQEEWEVLAYARELNEHSLKPEQTEDLPIRHDEELRYLSIQDSLRSQDLHTRLHLQLTPDIAGCPHEGNQNSL